MSRIFKSLIFCPQITQMNTDFSITQIGADAVQSSKGFAQKSFKYRFARFEHSPMGRRPKPKGIPKTTRTT